MLKLKKQKHRVSGIASLERDPTTNTRKWSCYSCESGETTEFVPGESLVLPPSQFPEGVRVIIEWPVEKIPEK